MSIRRVASGIVSAAGALMQDRFDSLRRIADVGDVPLFCVHGDADTLIPHEHSQQLARASVAEHRKVVIIPGGTHNALPGPWAARAADFFAQARSPSAAASPPALTAEEIWAALPPQPTDDALQAQVEKQHAQVAANERALTRLGGVVESVAGAASSVASLFRSG